LVAASVQASVMLPGVTAVATRPVGAAGTGAGAAVVAEATAVYAESPSALVARRR
jgi:hypothetical protein